MPIQTETQEHTATPLDLLFFHFGEDVYQKKQIQNINRRGEKRKKGRKEAGREHQGKREGKRKRKSRRKESKI